MEINFLCKVEHLIIMDTKFKHNWTVFKDLAWVTWH